MPPSLRSLREARLPLLLDGERCRINFTEPTIPPVIIRVRQVGMDYIAGMTSDDPPARIVVPLTAIAFVEFPP